MRGNRLSRVNDEIKKEISKLLLEKGLNDPRIHDMTTVTEVDTTEDLSHTKVYISVLGSDEDKQETMDGLNSAKGYIRKHLAKTVDLRKTPDITFVLDDTMEHAAYINKLIDEVIEDE